jgi:uncharacterized membrane protein
MTQQTFAGSEATAEKSHRTPLEWLGILGPIAGLALVVVFFSNTSWYLVFKAIHVLAAIVWLGGGTVITILAWKAQRAKDNAQLLQIGKQAEWASTRIFVPSALVVLAMGFVLMHKGGWSYGDFWPIFGLAAWGVSFVVGAAFLGPETGRLARLIEVRGPDDPAVIARLNRILAVARADVVLILLVAADMVAKPFLS